VPLFVFLAFMLRYYNSLAGLVLSA
jgi:hypothetical protein